MKQISSIDLNFLLKELEALKGSRIDKIYQPEKSLLVFSFYKAGLGKKILKVIIGQALFLAEEKESYGEILGFGMLLRKHLNGYFLDEISQIKPERILRLSFKAKKAKEKKAKEKKAEEKKAEDGEKSLYIEFFGKGNAILCDQNDIIINAIEHHEFKLRAIKPKNKYVYPRMNYSLFEINKEQMNELLKNSKKETSVACMAVELGMGGVYAEELCLLSNVGKNKSPKELGKKDIQSILNSIAKILSQKIEPRVMLRDSGPACGDRHAFSMPSFDGTPAFDSPVDAAPLDLEFYKNHEQKKLQSFSQALEFFYSHHRQLKETEFDKRLRGISRIIEQQKTAIERLKKDEQESREIGEMIYHKYSLIKEILEEINKAAKKYTWKEIKEKLEGHGIIKEVNEKERKVLIEI